MVDHFKQENEKLRARIAALEEENAVFESRLAALEAQLKRGVPAAPAAAAAPAEEDEDVDLFGESDDEEDAERERIKAERVAEYQARKSKKPTLIAKSEIVLDVKPWDDETDMKELEAAVRAISTEGLLWGGSKLVEVGYGIKKLQINCVVEDDKCGTDFLEENIVGLEDYVQSMDIVAFNKL